MKRTACVMAIAALAATAALGDGKQVYESVCIDCHGSGRDGAPKVGDAKAWEKLSSRGLTALGESALQGVRKMPPHGGRMSLDDADMKRAITYMVNQSGGHWTEPLDRRHLPAARSGESIVKSHCAKCHQTGVNGAPRLGDRDAWIGRAKLGFDGLVRSAMNGHGAMPARGGMADLTDGELRDAVTHMVQTSIRK
jgi:cytochrome c5